LQLSSCRTEQFMHAQLLHAVSQALPLLLLLLLLL
jgi:hypothetical protein